ncbi:MAG: DMT family transporter [Alphaproteobacteria bacterium]|nr:DMT family transporter [Alphaproteobacteria bacterium]
MPSWLIACLCLIGTGTMLGVSTTFAKLAANAGVAPLGFLTWSVVGASVILFVAAGLRRQFPPVNRQTAEYYLVAALVSVAAPNFLFFSAIPHVGAGFVALAITLPPLLTYLGALALRMERYRHIRALGVALALAGAGYIAVLKFQAPAAAGFWIMAALLGPVFLAAGNLYRTLRWPEGAKPDVLAPGMVGAAAGLLFLLGGVPGFTVAVPLQVPAALPLILAQSTTFALQFLLLFVLQKHGGPVYLSLLGSVSALVAVPLAIHLLGEAPPDGLLVGALLIGGGIVLMTADAARRKPA